MNQKSCRCEFEKICMTRGIDETIFKGRYRFNEQVKIWKNLHPEAKLVFYYFRKFGSGNAETLLNDVHNRALCPNLSKRNGILPLIKHELLEKTKVGYKITRKGETLRGQLLKRRKMFCD